MKRADALRVIHDLQEILPRAIAILRTYRDDKISEDEAFEAGMRAGEIAAKELAESVAKEVGGKFWETHMLNTGLLRFLAKLNVLPAAPEEKNP